MQYNVNILNNLSEEEIKLYNKECLINKESILTKEILDKITNILQIKKKALSSLLGVTATTLSMNVEKPFDEIKNNKLGKRLSSLLYVVETLSKDPTLSSKAILHVLTTPRHEREDGTYLDVISAIHLEIDRDFLMTIADDSLKYLRGKYDESKRPAEKSLYYQLNLC